MFLFQIMVKLVVAVKVSFDNMQSFTRQIHIKCSFFGHIGSATEQPLP